MNNNLTLAAHLVTTGNGLVGAVAARTLEERSSQWAKQVEGYMKDIGVDAADLKNMKKEKIKLKVDEREEERWR